MTGKFRFSVGIPSNRSFDHSRESIESAVSFAKKTGCQLVVSDNSGDSTKAERLSQIMDCEQMVYVATPPYNMAENWSSAFDRTEGDFVLMMGDDDRLFSLGVQPVFSDLPTDVVGIRPNILGYTDSSGILRMNASKTTSVDSFERVTEYLQTANGSNLGIFSFWRRDVLKSVYDLWLRFHPTKGAYCDWSMMSGLCSSGRVFRDPSTCYFYNLQNWSGTSAQISSQVERSFTRSDLPSGASQYAGLFAAVDSYIFIDRKDSPLEKNERRRTAVLCMDIYLKDYIRNPPKSWHANAEKIHELSRRLASENSVPKICDVLADIFTAIQPGLGDRYRAFYKEAIGSDWGF